MIPVTRAGGNPLPGKPTPPNTVDVPDWYPPAHDLPQNPLLNTQVTNKGVVTTPAACGKRISAFDLHGTSSQVDPLEATYTTSTEDEYDAAGQGLVCAISKYVVVTYSEEVPPALGSISSTSVITSVIVLTSETGPKPLFGLAGGAQPFSLDLPIPNRIERLRLTQ